MNRSVDFNVYVYGYIGMVFVLQMMYSLAVYLVQRWCSQFNLFGIFVHFCRDSTILQKCLFLSLLIGGTIIF